MGDYIKTGNWKHLFSHKPSRNGKEQWGYQADLSMPFLL